MRWLIFVLVLLLRTITVRNQHNEACTTSTAQRGRCVLSRECDYTLHILRANKITAEQIQFIEDNECGKVPNGYKLVRKKNMLDSRTKYYVTSNLDLLPSGI